MESTLSHTVYLALGSNIGDREAYLTRALEQLQCISDSKIIASQIFDTEPMGPTPQSKYLNLCAKLSTALSPLSLLEYCKTTESELGRIHRVKWGPREIDIDILFYDNDHINYPQLTIPHPEISKRIFVLMPLSQIAGHLRVPGLKVSLADYVMHLSRVNLQSVNIHSENINSQYAASQTH